jgi:hypothetical protein
MRRKLARRKKTKKTFLSCNTYYSFRRGIKIANERGSEMRKTRHWHASKRRGKCSFLLGSEATKKRKTKLKKGFKFHYEMSFSLLFAYLHEKGENQFSLVMFVLLYSKECEGWKEARFKLNTTILSTIFHFIYDLI